MYPQVGQPYASSPQQGYNFYGNQNAGLTNPYQNNYAPRLAASHTFKGPGTDFFARGQGQWYASAGSSGMLLEIPTIDPSVINAATVGYKQGMATPFADNYDFTNRLAPNSWFTSQFSPIDPTTGSSVIEPYSPLGGPFAGQFGNPLNNFFNGGSSGGGGFAGGLNPGGGYGAPAGGGSYGGGYGAPSAGGYGGGGYGAPGGGSYGGGGYGNTNGFPNYFNSPLFGQVPQGTIPGSGYTFGQAGGPYQNQVYSLNNGINNSIFQGNSATDPRQRGVIGVQRNQFGNYYGYVGPSGGRVATGLYGVATAGPESWGMITSAINPAMVIDFDSAAYRFTNFATKGFAPS